MKRATDYYKVIAGPGAPPGDTATRVADVPAARQIRTWVYPFAGSPTGRSGAAAQMRAITRAVDVGGRVVRWADGELVQDSAGASGCASGGAS